MPVPHHSMFTCQMLFPTPNQQYQSTEGRQRKGEFVDTAIVWARKIEHKSIIEITQTVWLFVVLVTI